MDECVRRKDRTEGKREIVAYTGRRKKSEFGEEKENKKKKSRRRRAKRDNRLPSTEASIFD